MLLGAVSGREVLGLSSRGAGCWEEWEWLGPGAEPARVTVTQMSALLRRKLQPGGRWADTAWERECMVAMVALAGSFGPHRASVPRRGAAGLSAGPGLPGEEGHCLLCSRVNVRQAPRGF